MIMRKTFYIFVALAALAACSKTETVSDNQKAQRYFEGWMSANYPDALAQGAWFQGRKDSYGCYADPGSEVEGTGEAVGSKPYVFVRFTSRSLTGEIITTTEPDTLRKIRKFDSNVHCGPVVWNRNEDFYAGVRSALASMKQGGKRRVIVPSWLMSSAWYDTGAEYFNAKDGTADARIYDIEVLYAVSESGFKQWTVDSLTKYVEAHPEYLFAKSAADVPAEKARFVRAPESSKDTTALGWWYQRLSQPSKEKAIPSDSTVYVNYVGRLIDGTVFDTNIRDTARKYGLYSSSSSSSTYSPMKVQMAKEYYDIKYISSSDGSENSLINGFTYTLKHMHPGENGVALFYQGLGYSYSRRTRIPAYSPLIFEFYLVKNE